MVDKTLTQLNQASQVDDTDILYAVKGGTTDVSVSVGQLKAHISELIRTPVAVNPLTGTTEFPVDGSLQASPYAPLYSADVREFREFQIDIAAGDFTSPVSSAQINADIWSISPAIPDNTDLQWRCRDKSVKGDYSEWSEPQTFKTYDIYVVTPVIIIPIEGGDLPERDQSVTSSTFQMANSSDTHAASYWTVKNSLGSVVYQTGRDTVNLTSWQPPLGVIVAGESMTVEVVYESSGGYFSEVGVRGFVGAAAPYGKYLAVAHNNAPRITAYGMNVDAFEKLENPTGLPTSDSYAVKFSKDGKYIAVGSLNSPFIFMYERSGDVISQASIPSQITNGSNSFDFNNDSTLMAVANSSSPYITLYSISGGLFSKLPDLSQLPSGRANSVSISWDGNYLAVAFEVSPYLMIYKKNGATYEAISGAISSAPAGNSTCVSFSQDGQYLAVSHANAPYLTIYKKNGDSFEKLNSPVELPSGTGRSVSFSSNANYLAVGHNTSPFLTIYSRSGDVFTKVQNPSTLPPNTANGVSFIADGSFLAVAHSSSPFLTIYKNESGVFVKVANPSTLPTGTGNACSFYPAI